MSLLQVIDITYDVSAGPDGLLPAIKDICDQAQVCGLFLHKSDAVHWLTTSHREGLQLLVAEFMFTPYDQQLAHPHTHFSLSCSLSLLHIV